MFDSNHIYIFNVIAFFKLTFLFVCTHTQDTPPVFGGVATTSEDNVVGVFAVRLQDDLHWFI